MLAGHYGPAFLLKARYPDVPLAALCIAVQAADVAFFVLVPLGIERIGLDPSMRGPLGMQLVSIPYTHSLTLTLACTALIAAAGWALRKNTLGWALALAIGSHWVLDLVVHVADLPLTLGEHAKVGFGLWRATWLAYALEVALVVVPAWWLSTRVAAGPGRRWLLGLGAVLVMIQTGYVLSPPPPDVLDMTRNAESIYLSIAIAAWFVDRRLTPRRVMRPASA